MQRKAKIDENTLLIKLKQGQKITYSDLGRSKKSQPTHYVTEGTSVFGLKKKAEVECRQYKIK